LPVFAKAHNFSLGKRGREEVAATEAAMNSQRSLFSTGKHSPDTAKAPVPEAIAQKNFSGAFVPGVVLGVGIGLLLSHLWIPRRHTFDTPFGAISAASHINQGDLHGSLVEQPFGMATAYETPYFPELDSFDLTEHDDSHPLRNALAMEMEPGIPSRLTGPLSPAPPKFPENEPGTLQVGDAAPLNSNLDQEYAVIRSIIDLELSHLPAEKREIWFDALKDIDKNDVPGVLRMWKTLGGPIPGLPMNASPGIGEETFSSNPFNLIPPLSSGPVVSPEPISTLEEHTESAASSTTAAVRAEMESILRQNALMRNTRGYIPKVPYLELNEAGEPELRVHHAFDMLTTVHTGSLLDIAIDGPGFFAVKNDAGETHFTRNGNFRADSQQRLALEIDGQTYHLFPELSLAKAGNTDWEFGISEHDVLYCFRRNPEDFRQIMEQVDLGRIDVAMPWQLEQLIEVKPGLYQLPESQQNQWGQRRSHTAPLLRHGDLELPRIPTLKTADFFE